MKKQEHKERYTRRKLWRPTRKEKLYERGRCKTTKGKVRQEGLRRNIQRGGEEGIYTKRGLGIDCVYDVQRHKTSGRKKGEGGLTVDVSVEEELPRGIPGRSFEVERSRF